MEEDCKCIRIEGHLEDVRWMLWPRLHKPGAGFLSLGDWVADPHIWLHYVESSDGLLHHDDVLVSTDTRYWSIHDVQRYFVGDLHCEKVLFTYQYPNLRMPTELGSHLWKSNASLKVPPAVYQKELNHSIGFTFKKLEQKEDQLDRLIISDQLMQLDRLDYFKRKTFLHHLKNIIRFQDRLQLVSFENLCCKRLEGVELIQQLACFNSKSLKYLFLWRFVLPNENPLLINYSYITVISYGLTPALDALRTYEKAICIWEFVVKNPVMSKHCSGQYIARPDSRYCFTQALGKLSNLRVLALEYSHIADGTGSALISLLPVIKRAHFRLQLICREDQTPGRADGSLGVGGYDIPDTAWRRVNISCPDLYVLMAFFRIRDYDNIRRFLTPSIPLRETHLQLGIDLKMRQRQDSDLSCFVRHMAYFYASTLVTLSIHQWRFAVFPLYRVVELMPRLVHIHYVGKVQDEVDLKRMLMIISCGVCNKLKHVKIQIQDDESKRDYWLKVVETLTEDFTDIMDLYNINLCLSIYKN